MKKCDLCTSKTDVNLYYCNSFPTYLCMKCYYKITENNKLYIWFVILFTLVLINISAFIKLIIDPDYFD